MKILGQFLTLTFLFSVVSGYCMPTDDIQLHVKDIVVDWAGGGGTKDNSTNSFTYKQYATNYWDIHDLSTDLYDRLELTFSKPVNYNNIHVTASYSDETSTVTTIKNGAKEHIVSFEPDKILEKIAVSHSWDGPAGEVTIYYDNIIIRAKESTGNISSMPVKSPKLGTDLANPILDFQYCADPTAIEYDGRLYVYGTNDHQQYESGAESNTYEKIKSLVIMSTDDMVNWTYHGLIQVNEIAPWIQASWAPSIISKKLDDGSTLFSLYFSNSGWGTGVIQAKSPVGPWTSPLKTSLIDGNNKVVAGSGAIFDPGAAVDDNGDAWLTFGNSQGWIAKLGSDLHSFDGNPVKLPTPFHFEANELNFINGNYVYTYNTDWSDHTPWTMGGEKPTACSMIYLKSSDPLNIDSWKYGGNYFKNPGENGMNYTNNHTHLHKFQDKWYLFYQMNMLEPAIGSSGGFRSIYVDEIEVDENNVKIKECIPTLKGVSAVRNFNPYVPQFASTAAATLGISYEPTETAGHTVAKIGTPSITAPVPAEGILEIRNVDFTKDDKVLKCLLKGNGSISLRVDSRDSQDIAKIDCNDPDWKEYTSEMTETLEGIHTIYLVLKGDILFDTWQIVDSASIDAISAQNEFLPDSIYDIQGRKLSSVPDGKSGIYIMNGKKIVIK